MNSLRHAELLAGHSSFDLRSLPNSHCSWRMTSWDGRGAGGCRPNYEWTKAEKGRMKQRKSVEADRQSSLIRFLGRMTKLCGMQRRGEREVIKSSATKRGGKNRWQTRGTRLAEELRTAEPSFIHFPSANKTCFVSPVTVQPKTAQQLFILVMEKAPFGFGEGIQQTWACASQSDLVIWRKKLSVYVKTYYICDRWHKKEIYKQMH